MVLVVANIVGIVGLFLLGEWRARLSYEEGYEDGARDVLEDYERFMK